MLKFNLMLICCIFVLTGIPQGANGCTTFQLNQSGHILVGKNYDWMVPDGLLMVNKRGVSKTAFVPTYMKAEMDRPASWTSKYGSVSFVQYGREQPAGGMNEAGLVVESMGLFGEGKYPDPDSRPSIVLQQWIQYQLDNFASVKEVIDSDARLRIQPKQGVRIHYLVSDKQGNCASIEWIEGKQVCHFNEKMPYKVLTNRYYSDSVEFCKQNRIPDPDKYKSIERFIRAAKMVENFGSEAAAPPLDYAFDILKSVSWSITREYEGKTYTSNTRWSIVYDSTDLRIHFKTFDNQNARSVDLAALDFSCSTPIMVFDINQKASGDITKDFIQYSEKLNRDLIEQAFSKTYYLPEIPSEYLDFLANYPEAFECRN